MTQKNGAVVTSGFVTEDLFSSIEALDGAKVEFVAMMPAEVPRQVKEYALFKVRKGRRTYRCIFAVMEVMRPCPPGGEMWDFLDTPEGEFPFFTDKEIRARYQNLPLDLPKFEPESG